MNWRVRLARWIAPSPWRFLWDEPHTVHLSRMQLEPGDYVVLRCHGRVSAEHLARLRETLRGVFVGHPVLVLDGDVDLFTAGRAVPRGVPE